jgi:hypothetical protein
MFNTKSLSILLLGSSLFYFTGCGKPDKLSVAEGGYYQSGLYFGSNFSSGYKKGIKDGCTTAKGDYRKNHYLFKNNVDYNDGWFLGRNRCKSLLIVEDENLTKTDDANVTPN